MKDKINKSKHIKYRAEDEKMYDVVQCRTFQANIYVGFKEGYEGQVPTFSNKIVQKICQSYCDSVGLALTIEETFF